MLTKLKQYSKAVGAALGGLIPSLGWLAAHNVLTGTAQHDVQNLLPYLIFVAPFLGAAVAPKNTDPVAEAKAASMLDRLEAFAARIEAAIPAPAVASVAPTPTPVVPVPTPVAVPTPGTGTVAVAVVEPPATPAA